MLTRALTFRIGLAVFVVMVGFQLQAADFGEAGAAESTDAAIVVDANEGGVAAVLEAQASTSGILHKEGQSAEEMLEAWAEENIKDFQLGWDEKKKRFFAIGQGSFSTKDPTADQSFLDKREVAARVAILRGRMDISRFVAVTMEAYDQFETVGTDVNNQLYGDYRAVCRQMESQRNELAKLLALSDKAEADDLAGATTGDRMNAAIDAAIKRLGSDFDSGKIAADKRAMFDKQKAAYLEAKKQYDVLVEKAEVIRAKEIAKFESKGSEQSDLRLTGSTVIYQTESWDDDAKEYQVATLVCWSSQLELAARATLTAEPVVLQGTVGKQTLKEWLASQDLGTMVGPRQFLDNEGRRHFIGIAAQPVVSGAQRNSSNRSFAETFARRAAAFSLYVHVEGTSKDTLAAIVTVGDDDVEETKIAKSLEETMRQSFEKKQVRGLQPLERKQITHAITGQKIHVAVFYINAKDAAAAIALEEQSARTAIAINKNQAWQQGRSEALRQQVEASKSDPASRAEGAAAGKAAAKETPKPATGTKATTPQPGQPTRTGAVGSGGKVEDDF